MGLRYPGGGLTNLGAALATALAKNVPLVITGPVEEVLEHNAGDSPLVLLGVAGSSLAGLRLKGTSKAAISGLTIRAASWPGVIAGASAKIEMNNCKISSQARCGVEVTGQATVTMLQCEISGCGGNGMNIMEGGSVEACEVLITANVRGHGISMGSTAPSLLQRCSVTNNDRRNGVVVMGMTPRGADVDISTLSPEIVLDNNILQGNRAYGLAVHSGACVLWKGGEVKENAMGDCQGKRTVLGWEVAPKRRSRAAAREAQRAAAMEMERMGLHMHR